MFKKHSSFASRQSESEVVSPHTPRHHVTTTHLCGGDMWHQKTVNKYNNVLQTVTITTVWTLTLWNNTLLKECVTMNHLTTWQRCDYTPCVIPDTDHLKEKLLKNRIGNISTLLEWKKQLPEQRQQKIRTYYRIDGLLIVKFPSETPNELWSVFWVGMYWPTLKAASNGYRLWKYIMNQSVGSIV